MNTKKTIGIVLLIVLAAAGGIWWLLRAKKQKEAAALTDAAKSAVSAADAATYQSLTDYFTANCNPDALTWMLPYVKDILDGKKPINEDYLVAGKLTKSGAFMAIYASTYYSFGYLMGGKVAGDTGYEAARDKVNTDLYTIFHQFQQSEISSAILSS